MRIYHTNIIVRIYKDAIAAVSGGRKYKRKLIRECLTLKGLPKKVGMREASEFFWPPNIEDKKQVFDSI